MEKNPYDIEETDSEPPLKPVVAHIPEPSSPRSAPVNLPRPLEKLLNNAALNRATQLLIERETSRTRVRQRIRGVLITDMRAPLSSPDVSEIFAFVMKTGELKNEEGLKWSAMQLNLNLNGAEHVCRFLLSETRNFGLITIHLSVSAEKPFNPTAWGMGPNQATLLENFLGRTHGLVLFCGTDTDDLFPYIQSLTKQLATPERHAIAVGANTQAWFPGVEQLVSNNDPEAFSKLLKVAFRHAPDLVVAHPLEKKAHLDICLSEAVRGRLVFGRVYATDISDALLQILGMGVEPYLIGAGLLGVVAQRTLRLNCQKCQDKDNVSRDRLKDLNIPIGMQPTAFYNGKGCDACFKTGFDRETNIFEVIEMNDDLRNKLHRDMKSDAMRSLMKTGGLMTLRQVALHKAINGQTSLAEVLRVTP